jgi:hypothetical protein
MNKLLRQGFARAADGSWKIFELWEAVILGQKKELRFKKYRGSYSGRVSPEPPIAVGKLTCRSVE